MKVKLLLLTLVLSVSGLLARASGNTSTGTPGTGEDNKKTDIAGGVIHAETKKPIGNVSVTA